MSYKSRDDSLVLKSDIITTHSSHQTREGSRRLGTRLKILSSCVSESKIVDSKIWRNNRLCLCNKVFAVCVFSPFKELRELYHAYCQRTLSVETCHPLKICLRAVRAVANFRPRVALCFSKGEVGADKF